MRQYTDWGLVRAARRSHSNYRLFTHHALGCLHQVRLLRSLGLTMAEIRGLYAAGGDGLLGPLLADRLRRVRVRLDIQIGDLRQMRRRIDQFEARRR